MEMSVASLNPASPSQLLGEEEVRPYKIHVSSKYLDLTRKKLELTRLPHELRLEDVEGEDAERKRDRQWELGTPKGEIEPLVDFWLEAYAWRPHEAYLNTIPQFRTAFSSLKHPLQRIHFIHIPSSSPAAIPLLLIPSFPLTNLSLEPLFPLLKEEFHIVVPNIPGLGFSDAFQRSYSGEEEGGVLEQTAKLFDKLMTRLGYHFYLTSATGSGKESLGGIDYHLPKLMGEMFQGCLGVHILDPCVSAPEIGNGFGNWMKWRVAEFFHCGWFGYDSGDWIGLRNSQPRNKAIEVKRGYSVLGRLGLREPNTFSYALCDSPVGLLSFVLSALRKRSPEHELQKEQIINLAQLAWLPGPEAGMRFWASTIKEVEVLKTRKSVRSRVAVTVFGSEGGEADYICPAWANDKHEIVFSRREAGRAGLLVWEKKDVLVEGIRGLAREIEQVDPRLKVQALQEVVVAPIEEPIQEEVELMTESEFDEYEESADGLQLEAESPDTVVAAPRK